MIRVLEIILSLIIVFLIAVVVAVFLPSSGHVERVVELSNPVRQVYDTVNGFGARGPTCGAVVHQPCRQN